MPPGSLLQVQLHQLRPTQPAIGHDQVLYKLGKYACDRRKLFDDYCEANGQHLSGGFQPSTSLRSAGDALGVRPPGSCPDEMKTVVIGPGRQLYLTDGHHTFSAFWEHPGGGPETPVWVRVTDDFSDAATMADFWIRLLDERKAWLKDPQGRPILPEQLPPTLGLSAMADDPYRALVYFTRQIGYDKPRTPDGRVLPSEFLEFYWAEWLRMLLPLRDYDLDDRKSYAKAVEQAARLMVANPGMLIGSSGRTALEMGAYRALDKKVLRKLSSSDGKFTYLLAARAQRAALCRAI
ncbi:ParB/Srx family N-terminal domain-containing protein [Pseudomonas sp. HR1]|uniref:ParB/Srx family N-terminal domain-containing protein n=1 Tax=Pseudomonas sp. HR1 TaxID=1463361 RepID=UPI002542E278|nr:ParB/Srx family N-terminal domain-containing protein [Pseudomonas sp. HR1]